jgi:hypothetical protein
MVKFSVAVGLLLVMICWTTGSTGATISLSEEKFLKLMENYVRIILAYSNINNMI